MPPRKSLAELVASRSFLAHRHASRLLEAPLPQEALRQLQERYRSEGDERVRASIAKAFERKLQASADGLEAETEDALEELNRIVNAPPEPWEPG